MYILILKVGAAHFLFSPASLPPVMSTSTSRLETEVRQLFEDEGVVLLEFSARGQGGRLMLRAVADRRHGSLTIADCAHLTRQIQHLVREKKLLNDDYRLEVTSPGLDYPLREEWQFTKNIGRLMKATVAGERGPKEINARLTAADAAGITLTSDATQWNLRYSELISVRVLPEFKPPRME
jgi:ribosome maturation factor RimP